MLMITHGEAAEWVRYGLIDSVHVAQKPALVGSVTFELLFNLIDQKPLAYSTDGKHPHVFASKGEAFAVTQNIGLGPDMKRLPCELTPADRGLLTPSVARVMLAARWLMYYKIMGKPQGCDFRLRFNRFRGRMTVLVDPDSYEPLSFPSAWRAYQAAIALGFPRLRQETEDDLERGRNLRWFVAEQWASDDNEGEE